MRFFLLQIKNIVSWHRLPTATFFLLDWRRDQYTFLAHILDGYTTRVRGKYVLRKKVRIVRPIISLGLNGD